jgi:hypothetical protein
MSLKVVSRTASLMVVATYVCLAARDELPKGMERTLGLAFLLGLPLIWFPELIGTAIISTLDRPAPTETPPVLVALMGWVFLLAIPIVATLLLRDATPGVPVQRIFPR